jgi:hypothetical protein
LADLGWKQDVAQEQHTATLEMNRAIIDIIDNVHMNRTDDDIDDSIGCSSMISYVNWGDAVAPRSFAVTSNPITGWSRDKCSSK